MTLTLTLTLNPKEFSTWPQNLPQFVILRMNLKDHVTDTDPQQSISALFGLKDIALVTMVHMVYQ